MKTDAKKNNAAQRLMRTHGKEEIFAVGEHFYFSRHNALITADGDTSKVIRIKAEVKTESDEEDDDAPVKKKKASAKAKKESRPEGSLEDKTEDSRE